MKGLFLSLLTFFLYSSAAIASEELCAPLFGLAPIFLGQKVDSHQGDQTAAFINYLDSLLTQKTIAEKELLNLLEGLQAKELRNPIHWTLISRAQEMGRPYGRGAGRLMLAFVLSTISGVLLPSRV